MRNRCSKIAQNGLLSSLIVKAVNIFESVSAGSFGYSTVLRGGPGQSPIEVGRVRDPHTTRGEV